MSTKIITHSSLNSSTNSRFSRRSPITHDKNHIYIPIPNSFYSSRFNKSSLNLLELNFNPRFSIKALSSSDESHGKSDKKSSSGWWKKWAVGLAFSIFVPSSLGHKVPPLMILKSRVDNVLGQVETISEIVEDIAEETVKIADEIEKRLPEEAKNLKEATEMVEKLARIIDKEADRTQELIHKVEEVEREVEKLVEEAAATKDKNDDEHKMH